MSFDLQVTDKFEQAGFHWGRGVVASLGQSWSTYPHTRSGGQAASWPEMTCRAPRLWLTKTRLVMGRTPTVLLQGLQAETRLRKMEVSCWRRREEQLQEVKDKKL